MKLMNVKGTSDSLPNKEIIKRRVVNILTDTFEKYGYYRLIVVFCVIMIYLLVSMLVVVKF